MKKIFLTKMQVTMVSDHCYVDLMQFKWYAWWSPGTRSFYAVRHVSLPNGRQATELMHRRILGLKKGDWRKTDHINHLTLDNQDENLQIVTTRGNAENQRNQSKYGAGVQFCSRYKKRPFRVQVRLNGRRHHIGYFVTAEEAQAARKDWLIKTEII